MEYAVSQTVIASMRHEKAGSLGQISKFSFRQTGKCLRSDSDIQADFTAGDADGFIEDGCFVNKSRENFFHSDRRAAAVNVTGQS